MISGATGLSFTDVLFNLGPIVLVIFTVVLLILKFIFREQLRISEDNKKKN